MRLVWDNEILWIFVDKLQSICLNSYQAQELLQKLYEEKDRIDAQAVIDEAEFGRDNA